MTENKIYNDVIEEYFDYFDKETDDVEKIEEELLRLIAEKIKAENQLREKGERLKIPQKLEPPIIAEIILRLYHICRISYNNSNIEMNNDLYIYQDCVENEGLYVNDDNRLYEIIKKFNKYISSKDVAEVMRLLSLNAPIKEKTRDKELVAVNNGIFDYKNKILMPFSSEYVFTTKSRIDYLPRPQNPKIHNNEDNTDWDIESWIKELSDDPEIVKLLWQILGAIIRPNVPWHKAIFFYNERGNNGKGSLCELLRNLCGKGNYVALSLSNLTDKFMLAAAADASAIMADENDTKDFIKSVAALKSIITGDVVLADRKFQTPIEFKFHGLVVECLNDLPKINDKSESLYRRFIFVPFEKCFSNAEKKYIKEDYLNRKEVLEYVLYKVLNTNYYEFDVPEVCKQLLNEFKTYNDPVREFCDEIFDRLTWNFVPNEFLYALYKAWLNKNCPSGTPLGKYTFLKNVKILISENNYGWHVDNSGTNRDKYFSEPELLIAEYNLTEFMNPIYRGADINQICTFKPTKKSYNGFMRNGF